MLLNKRNLNWLNKEFQTLREQDLLSDFQLEAIHAYYQSRFKESKKKALKLTAILVGSLACIIGALVFTLYR